MKYIIAIILLLASKLSFSDWLDYYIDMDCDAANSAATLVPRDIYNILKKQRTAECDFKNGITIKAKFGIGRAYAYGQGGGDPAKWVSLWINKAKVLSRQRIGCFADGPCSMHFKLSENHLEICRLVPTYSDKYRAPTIPTDFDCSRILYEYLNQAVDYIEYPDEESQYPKPGTTNIFYSSNSAFCHKFIKDGKYEFPTEAFSLRDEQTAEYEYAGNWGRLDADFNNDGNIDEAYVLHSRIGYNDGDSFFIFDKEKSTLSNWPNIDLKELEERKKYVFPNQWGSCNNDAGCSYDTYGHLALLAPDPGSLALPFFQIRYLRASPFILDNTLYMHLSSVREIDDHITAILKPLPNGSAEHVCYFNRVRENY